MPVTPNDAVVGSEDNDSVSLSSGYSDRTNLGMTIWLGEGNDTFTAEKTDVSPQLHGGDGNDVVSGASLLNAQTIFWGEAGNDVLSIAVPYLIWKVEMPTFVTGEGHDIVAGQSIVTDFQTGARSTWPICLATPMPCRGRVQQPARPQHRLSRWLRPCPWPDSTWPQRRTPGLTISSRTPPAPTEPRHRTA